MEDLIFIVLFIAVPVTILTMGFIAVLTREKRELEGHSDLDERPPTRM